MRLLCSDKGECYLFARPLDGGALADCICAKESNATPIDASAGPAVAQLVDTRITCTVAES